MAKAAPKGSVGKKTGGDTRKAIRSAQKAGMSLAQIGRAAGRDASTISGILSGAIKNPPGGLATTIRKKTMKA
jgi:hypothetical protein